MRTITIGISNRRGPDVLEADDSDRRQQFQLSKMNLFHQNTLLTVELRYRNISEYTGEAIITQLQHVSGTIAYSSMRKNID